MRDLEHAEAVPVQVVDPVRDGWGPVGGAAIPAAITGGNVRHAPQVRAPTGHVLPSPGGR
ncbi:hypothetical protein GCM10023107_66440 [Actinoplanes octamycinicus]|nr:hypothetical protein Aoc01nite_82200 [Actinoplanes octamycinicus]